MINIEAIVISEDHYNALGIARSLGTYLIPVNLILTTTKNANSFVSRSRYVTKVYKVGHDEKEIVEAIKDAASDCDKRYAVFPLSDFAAQIVDRFFTRFGDNILIPHMNGKMFEQSDKYIMKKKAEQFGMLTPKGVTLDLPAKELHWETYPAIIKPLVSVEGAKADIVTVYQRQDLENEISAFERKGYNRVLIEEFISGNDEHMVEILGERSPNIGCRFSRIIQKVREYPIKNGSTAFARFVDSHPGVSFKQLELMLDDYGFNGLFDFEFKFANGKLYFIECNFRNGAPGWASTLDGMNLPVLWILDCLNKGVGKNYTKNKIDFFMYEQNDVINMLKRDVKVLIWLSDYAKSKKCFRYRKDLKPSIMYYWLFVINRFKKGGE